MKALLLAGGLGTRLGDLSRRKPKCLQIVGGVTILDRLVAQLSDVGVDEFLINTHHLGEQIYEHVNEAPWADRVTLVHEPELLGTLGTLRSNASFFAGQGGWVLHADNYVSGDLEALSYAFTRRLPALWGAMLTFHVEDPRDFGVVTRDEQGIMTGFFEKVEDPPTCLANAAIYRFDDRLLTYVTSQVQEGSDLSLDLIPRLVGRLLVVHHQFPVVDIGTPEGLVKARSLEALRDKV